MRRAIGCVAVSVGLVVAFFLTRGLDSPTPNPQGGFSFAVMGDAPYYWWEDLRFRLVLEVPGSPDVGWVRVTVTPGARNPFAFEKHVIPRWKYW